MIGWHNNVWSFFARTVACPACGKRNRFYVDDPTLRPVCGQCRSALPVDSAALGHIDRTGLRLDKGGYPRPPRPERWWRRWGREVRALIIDGNLCTAAERRAPIDRFIRARSFYWELCRQVKEDKRAEERQRQEQEEARRLAEEFRRSAEEERLRRERDQWRQSKAGRLEAQLAEVPLMTGRQFELFLGEVFEVSGCAVEVTPESCDQGVDVIVNSGTGSRLAVQAKNVSTPTGNAAVQEVYAGMGFYDCPLGLVVARGGFTRSARRLAHKLSVRLWTLDDVRRAIIEGGPRVGT